MALWVRLTQSRCPSHWAPSLTPHTTRDTTQAPASRSCEHNVQLHTQRCDGTHAAEPGAQRGGRHTTHTAVATPTRSGTAQGHRSGRRRLQPHQWCITSTKQCSGTSPQRRTFHRSTATSATVVRERSGVCERLRLVRGAAGGGGGVTVHLVLAPCVAMSLLLCPCFSTCLCLCVCDRCVAAA